MKYKNAQEFIDACKIGMDIEFDYKRVGYGILGWYKGGPLAYRKEGYGYYEQHFPTPEALLDGFVLNGKPLRDIITKVDVLLT